VDRERIKAIAGDFTVPLDTVSFEVNVPQSALAT
jgi:hypothetical protein